MIPMKPHLVRCRPYVPGFHPKEGANVIKLNQNESPYPPSPLVMQMLHMPDLAERLRTYPDSGSSELRKAIAESLGYSLTPANILPVNGSDEAITLLFRVYLPEGARVALPDPTYAIYTNAAAAAGADIVPVPTRSDFTIDAEGLSRSWADAIFLVNPNNPTGLLLRQKDIAELASRFRGLLVIDEAYIDFAATEETALSFILSYPHVVVLRTFSKSYGLCGARVGFLAGPAAIVDALERVRDTFNVNAISRLLAAAALQDDAYRKETVELVCQTRREFTQSLKELRFEVVPSEANFVLCRPPRVQAELLLRQLAERGILVRHFATERLKDWLRISIGTPEQMKVVEKELQRLS